MQYFKAHGKLLLSAEYFILDGARGLALPTKFSQTMRVEPAEEEGIFWTSLDKENSIWFEAHYSGLLETISTTDEERARTLRNILFNCGLPAKNLRFSTRLDFPTDWGLGSSSTLISLIAQYTGADPNALLSKSFGGSGYDIACATSDTPIHYQLLPEGGRKVQAANFDPPFQKQLYFLHLGKKQNSREGIRHYRQLMIDKTPFVREISDLTDKLTASLELDEFRHYLDAHESLVAGVLGLTRVKECYFSDFPGSIKSLGAWGGDFVLVASDEDEALIRRYFSDKGFSTMLSYADMIL